MTFMEQRPSHDITLWVFMSYFLLSIFLVGCLFWPFGATILMAAAVTGLFYALYERLTRKLPPVLPSLITCLVIFLVFLSIIGGLKLFGILGIIYGPLVMTAFLTLTDIYHRNYEMRMVTKPPLKP